MANENIGFGSWALVPNGSTFELSVEGKGTPLEQTFVASARVHVNSGDTEAWTDQALRPGPRKKIISAPFLYIVRVRISFSGSTPATAIIRASVTDPNGTVLNANTPFEYEVSGKNGELGHARLSIVTLS